MESGEGIESRLHKDGGKAPDPTWNPVKELKDVVWRGVAAAMAALVESGEGIESERFPEHGLKIGICRVESGEGIESHRGGDEKTRNRSEWNPVKELKVAAGNDELHCAVRGIR